MIQNRLKSERMHRKISQKGLASELGVSQQTIASWEVGRTEPDQQMIKKIADFFEVSTDYLLEKTPFRTPSTLKEDEKDIAMQLDKLKQLLESQTGLLFSGSDMDDETKEYLLESLEHTIRQSKIMAKNKQRSNQ